VRFVERQLTVSLFGPAKLRTKFIEHPMPVADRRRRGLRPWNRLFNPAILGLHSAAVARCFGFLRDWLVHANLPFARFSTEKPQTPKGR
jgi:hypothetical protein